VEDRHPGHRIGVDRPLTVNFFHAFILHRRVLSFTCLISEEFHWHILTKGSGNDCSRINIKDSGQ
jgi:hypothetical protein